MKPHSNLMIPYITVGTSKKQEHNHLSVLLLDIWSWSKFFSSEKNQSMRGSSWFLTLVSKRLQRISWFFVSSDKNWPPRNVEFVSQVLMHHLSDRPLRYLNFFSNRAHWFSASLSIIFCNRSISLYIVLTFWMCFRSETVEISSREATNSFRTLYTNNRATF